LIDTRYGGDHDDIYRYEVKADEKIPVLPLNQWTSVWISKQDGTLLFTQEDY
jgi:hypothetical protein